MERIKSHRLYRELNDIHEPFTLPDRIDQKIELIEKYNITSMQHGLETDLKAFTNNRECFKARLQYATRNFTSTQSLADYYFTKDWLSVIENEKKHHLKNFIDTLLD